MDAKRLIKGSGEYENIYSNYLVKWWNFWKFPIIPVESLPTNMVVAYHDNRPVCAGFLYITDSNITWLEWIVADNEAEKTVRANGIETVINCVKVLAQAIGAGTVFTSSKNESLNKRLKEKFQPTDSGMSHFIWRC